MNIIINLVDTEEYASGKKTPRRFFKALLPEFSRKLGARQTERADAVILELGELAILFRSFSTLARRIE